MVHFGRDQRVAGCDDIYHICGQAKSHLKLTEKNHQQNGS